jgi:peptide/nickel transport system ATP-binding protein/oligopeptide transport system ATP-binding protein
MSDELTRTRETTDSSEEPLLRARGVKKHFPIEKGILQRQVGTVKAVDGVDLDIYPGEIHGIVGESGCGKSTLLETLLYLQEPTAGELVFDGMSFGDLSTSERRKLRTQVQIVFQDPDGSLNPRMPVKRIVGEPLHVHTDATDRQIQARILDLLTDVGLGTEHLTRYPHELSGGQKQRVAIARALAVNPKLVVLDEPTSALDVSVQSQILNLLKELKAEHDLTYVFVTHDLSVVRYISDRISVMYLGNIIEQAPVETLFDEPKHPYTHALLSAIPVPDVDYEPEDEIVLPGNVPDPSDPPDGCRFHPRCPIVEDECTEAFPDFERHGGTEVRCIRVDDDVELTSN